MIRSPSSVRSLLVVRPGAPSSFLAPSSDALCSCLFLRKSFGADTAKVLDTAAKQAPTSPSTCHDACSAVRPVVTSATLLVTGALLLVTRSY